MDGIGTTVLELECTLRTVPIGSKAMGGAAASGAAACGAAGGMTGTPDGACGERGGGGNTGGTKVDVRTCPTASEELLYGIATNALELEFTPRKVPVGAAASGAAAGSVGGGIGEAPDVPVAGLALLAIQ